MMDSMLPIEIVRGKIYLIRGQKVLLDADLAEMYGVETGSLNRAVKRNIVRFPSDFMFQLTADETLGLKCQFGIAKAEGRGGRRTMPYAFTEQGVAMLSSVLSSDRAVQVNIAIMRAFVQMRELASSNRAVAKRLDDLEKKYDAQFKVVFDAIRQLVGSSEQKKRKIGFERGVRGVGDLLSVELVHGWLSRVRGLEKNRSASGFLLNLQLCNPNLFHFLINYECNRR